MLKNLSAANESGKNLISVFLCSSNYFYSTEGNIQDVFEGVSKLKLTSSLKHVSLVTFSDFYWASKESPNFTTL